MAPGFAVIFLILATLLLFFVPLLPALIELRRKSDAAPLKIIRDYDVDIHHFPKSFRRYIDKHYHGAIEYCDGREKPYYGKDEEGKKYIVFSEENITLRDDEKHNQFSQRIFLGCHSLRSPGAMSYLAEMYARGSVIGGEEDIYRAILAEQDIRLEPQSMLLRWLHAGRNFIAGNDCILHGRVSADQLIRLEAGCHFERLYAPRIEFGSHKSQMQTVITPVASDNQLRRRLHERDVEILDNANIDADLVVIGKLHIGSDSQIIGSVKSHEPIHIEHDAKISGSIVTESDLYLDDNCIVMGPIIAEGDVYIGNGCQIGTAEKLTTITAKRIFITTGSVSYGTVWAHEHGAVIENKSS